jgi:hypothetical protein
MATVKDAMNSWGINHLRTSSYVSANGRSIGTRNVDIPDDAEVTFTESLPDSSYCETCGPDPFKVVIESGPYQVQYYGTMGDIIQEILRGEAH